MIHGYVGLFGPVDKGSGRTYGPAKSGSRVVIWAAIRQKRAIETMKVRNSLRSVRKRHRDNRVVRRRGRLYVINKVNRRFKARQG